MSFRIGTFLASLTILPNVFRSPAGIGGRAACGPVVLRYPNLVAATGDADEESHRRSAHGNRDRQQQVTAAWQSVLHELLPGAKVLSSRGPLRKRKGKSTLRLTHWILPSVLHTTAHFSARRSQYRHAAARERGACHARDLLNNSQMAQLTTVKDVQAHLRHTNAKTTLEPYIKSVPQSVRVALESLDQLHKKPNEPGTPAN
jgi:hypothetical protein